MTDKKKPEGDVAVTAPDPKPEVTTNPVVARLLEVGVEAGPAAKLVADMGATSVDQLAFVTADDLVAAGVGKLPARAIEAKLTAKPEPATPAAPIVAPSANGGSSGGSVRTSLLSEPEDHTSILDMLRVGGVAKMTEADAITAVRGAYSRSAGINKIIPTLLDHVLAHAEALDKPAGPVYFKVLKAYRRRQYGEVLEAFEGAITTVADGEKQRFLDKVDQLWTAFAAFQQHLDAYRELYRDESSDLGALAEAFRSGGAAVEMPDPSDVVMAGRALIDRFNRAFGGLGIPAARTIGKDMSEQMKILADPELPAQVGASDFEEMIRKLELTVPSDARQNEINMAKFVRGLFRLEGQSSDVLPRYVLEMQRLGKLIYWPGIGKVASPGTGNGGGHPFPSDDPKASRRRTL